MSKRSSKETIATCDLSRPFFSLPIWSSHAGVTARFRLSPVSGAEKQVWLSSILGLPRHQSPLLRPHLKEQPKNKLHSWALSIDIEGGTSIMGFNPTGMTKRQEK